MFASVWNSMPLGKRRALLKDAGYSAHFAGRSFYFIPEYVRIDLDYCYRRQVAA